MEHVGSEYIVMLNNRQIREGLIRDADSSGGAGQAANSSEVLRRWFAHTLHELASRVDPAAQTVDLTPAVQEVAPVW